MTQAWSYQGKRVVIAGCFSGIGAACAHELVNLGAEVHGVDIRAPTAPMASFTAIDLNDPTAIDEAAKTVGGMIDGEIDALFNCAGLPQTFPAKQVVQVNFLGLRRWTEHWIPRIRRGGGVVGISSVVARDYARRLAALNEFIALTGQDAAEAWLDAHPDLVRDGYAFAKEALIVWTMRRAVELAGQGIRINCVCPGAVQTPMMPAFEQVAGALVIDVLTAPTGKRSTPEQQAWPLIFLNSDMASYVSGVALPVDGGLMGGSTSGALDLKAMLREAVKQV
jgi:NAD(P)-dependent dehydrogenase (short-subunit alcohol dehydrogenase family)